MCGGHEQEVLAFRYAFRGRFLFGVRCRGCSLVYIDPQPSESEIRDLYSEDYFTRCNEECGAHGPAPYMEMAELSARRREAAARRLDGLIARHRKQRGCLLEIGCGPGFLLAAMRDLGWSALGLEISEYAVRQAREKLGLEVSLGTIDSARFPPQTADAVLMGDVLEHLPRPLESLRTVRTWLRPDGLLLVALPSTLNLVSAKLGLAFYRNRRKFRTLRIPPYHLFEYTPRTARSLLGAAGFRTLELRQSTVPLGKMALRGAVLEKIGKATLQVFAHATARLLNAGGDRLLLVAARSGTDE